MTGRRVLQVGVRGTVGTAVHAALVARDHDVVAADFVSGHLPVDVLDSASIAALYERVGEVDAVVCTVGPLDLAPLEDLRLDNVRASVNGKLLSQIDLVLHGLPYVRTGGSFTLVSGIMAHTPWRGGIGAAVANGGIESFVGAVAAEIDRDRRINAVSPSILNESIALQPGGRNPLPGHPPIPASAVADAFVRSVEGIETGRVFAVGH